MPPGYHKGLKSVIRSVELYATSLCEGARITSENRYGNNSPTSNAETVISFLVFSVSKFPRLFTYKNKT